LFGEERCPDQAVRPQVRLQCCLRKKGRAGGPDKICSDPDEPLRTG
jgi:hypothetical protein